MNANDLFNKIAAILYRERSEREFFITISGIEGRFSLGEMGMAKHHLVDALPREILAFVRTEVSSIPED